MFVFSTACCRLKKWVCSAKHFPIMTPWHSHLHSSITISYSNIPCTAHQSFLSIFLFTVTRGCPGGFSNSLLHAVVQKYFQIDCRTRGPRTIFKIDCRTRVSKSIFKLTVARRGPGLFSNWLSHAGVQEYFQIDCRTRLSRSISNLTVACGCPELFSYWLSHAGVQEYDWHCWHCWHWWHCLHCLHCLHFTQKVTS